MKKDIKFVIIGLVMLVAVVLSSGCESMGRASKTIGSDFGGGLDRHITVYSENGTLLAEYDGTVDIQDSESGNKVLFDLNGKRTVIYNGIVIAQEK